MTPARPRGAALLVVLLVTVAASLAGLLLFLRLVERRHRVGDDGAAAVAAAESGIRSAEERVRGEEGPELVLGAGFSRESTQGFLLRVQLESGAAADVAKPRFAGVSSRGGSNLDRVNQSGFVSQAWRITSSARSGREGGDVRMRADLILGPIPIDISRLPEPD